MFKSYLVKYYLKTKMIIIFQIKLSLDSYNKITVYSKNEKDINNLGYINHVRRENYDKRPDKKINL